MSWKRQSQSIPAAARLVGSGAICLIALFFTLLWNRRLQLVFFAGQCINLLFPSHLRPGVAARRKYEKWKDSFMLCTNMI